MKIYLHYTQIIFVEYIFNKQFICYVYKICISIQRTIHELAV